MTHPSTERFGAQDVARAAAFVRERTDLKPQLAIVLGSGLGGFAEHVHKPHRCQYADVPGMPTPNVVGHAGALLLGHIGAVAVMVFQGRVHAYEGHSQAAATFNVRLAAEMGCKRLLVTNAAGGLNPHMSAGDLMIICDQLNLTGTSPLVGPNDDALGPRFVDMSEAYARSGRASWRRAAHALGRTLLQGTYAGVMGPAYETPAEVRALRLQGADAVGMSTVSEVLMARHRGLEVAGLSVITNLGAGLKTGHLSHEEVTHVARDVQGPVSELLLGMVETWCADAR